jgi:hypothetical protein
LPPAPLPVGHVTLHRRTDGPNRSSLTSDTFALRPVTAEVGFQQHNGAQGKSQDENPAFNSK